MTRFAFNILMERLTDAVEKQGLRPLAAAKNIPVGVLRSVLASRDPALSNAELVARALGLEFYCGPPRFNGPETSAHPDDYLQIPVFNVTLAAGAGSHNQAEEVVDHLAFRKDWLRRIGVIPASAVIARARGDSMAPTIQDGDLILIDRARADPPASLRDPKDTRLAPIYAVVDDGSARVKRIELAGAGILALLSDSPTTPAEFRPTSAVAIIGRVMWWGHTNME